MAKCRFATGFADDLTLVVLQITAANKSDAPAADAKQEEVVALPP